MTGNGDFSIGSKVWPGTSKLLEEMGELQQVLGKLIQLAGDTGHWSGDLRKMMVEEVGDVRAAVSFFCKNNLTPEEMIATAKRAGEKFVLFEKWHSEQSK